MNSPQVFLILGVSFTYFVLTVLGIDLITKPPKICGNKTYPILIENNENTQDTMTGNLIIPFDIGNNVLVHLEIFIANRFIKDWLLVENLTENLCELPEKYGFKFIVENIEKTLNLKIKCPIIKGTYPLNGLPLRYKNVERLNALSNGRIKIMAQLLDSLTNQELLCTEVYGEVI